jgi:hypothetical protein
MHLHPQGADIVIRKEGDFAVVDVTTQEATYSSSGRTVIEAFHNLPAEAARHFAFLTIVH